MDTSDTQAYVRSRMYEPQYGILAATENEALAKSPKWAPPLPKPPAPLP